MINEVSFLVMERKANETLLACADEESRLFLLKRVTSGILLFDQNYLLRIFQNLHISLKAPKFTSFPHLSHLAPPQPNTRAEMIFMEK